MLINKDPSRAWTLDLRLRSDGTERTPTGTADDRLVLVRPVPLARGIRPRLRAPRPAPAHTSQPAAAPLTLPPMSLTIVRVTP